MLAISGGATATSKAATIGYGTGGDGTVTVDGVGSTWTSNERLTVGNYGHGTLAITNGGVAVSYFQVWIGNWAGSIGAVTLDGAGSTWTSNVGLIVGYLGHGTLAITNGGVAAVNGGYIAGTMGSDGAVTVDGAGSRWTNNAGITVGDLGHGTLGITNGGYVDSSDVTIGNGETGVGTATVDGAASQWFMYGAMQVGVSGHGTLAITNGGYVYSSGVNIGTGATGVGTATVDGAGSQLTSDLIVGDGGDGALAITNGGHVTSDWGTIGFNSTGVGTATVDGAGSTWSNLRDLTVGASGAGTLTIDAGGLVRVDGILSIGNLGKVDLNNGTLRVGDVDNTSGGIFTFTQGTLEFTSDQTLSNFGTIDRLVSLSSGIKLGKTLAIDGTATLMSNVAINGGTFSVGDLKNAAFLQFNRGTLAFTGDLLISAAGAFGSTLEIGPDQRIEVVDNAIVYPDGLLSIGRRGSFNAAILDNYGEINLGDSTARIGNGWLTNNGLLGGTGRVDAVLMNMGEVRADAGQRLVFSASGAANASTIDAVGGRIEFLGNLNNQANISVIGGTLKTASTINQAGALIGAGNALLQFDQGLTNLGQLSFTTGASNIIGDITNTGGIIAVGGSSIASFYGNLHNNGTVKVLTGSTAIILGNASGAGNYGGGGTIEFLGTFSPGNSPAQVHLDNDVTLGGAGNAVIELGGLVAGSEYDKIVVNRILNLENGTLDVALLNGFAPQPGDSFDILDWGTISGQFGQINLPQGYAWDTSRLYQTGVLRVVPEPTSATVLLIGAMALSLRRRRRRA